MRSYVSLPRAVVAGVLLVAVSGCGWLRNTNELYVEAPENRPLEVPPDLDLPRTGDAAAATGSVTASGTVAAAAGSAPAGGSAAPPAGAVPAAAGPSGFTVAGNREDVFARVDTALAAIEGVSVASRAELLGVFDVNYQQANFLVRVSDVDAGAYVSAVDPRGMPVTDAAALQLIEQLQAALGSN
jgi:uncharacterized lipoprotein